MTGSAGERLAGDYIVSELQRMGAKPLPGQSDFRLPFDFTAGTSDAGSSLVVTPASAAASTFRTRGEVQALSFSDDAEASGPLVFAGYGLVVPEGQGFDYDSYAGLHVRAGCATGDLLEDQTAHRDTRV